MDPRMVTAVACAALVLVLSPINSQPAPPDILALMSPMETRSCGVANLSGDQQAALNAWIARTLRAAIDASGGSGIYSAPGEGHWVSESAIDGRVVLLEDGSLWEIASPDCVDTMLWLPTTEVTVIKNSHAFGAYRYLLVNTEDNENATARFLGTE